jgi:membrane fusion protein (multidrug efflux system)
MDGRYAGSHMADEAEKTEIEGAPGKKRMSRTTLRVLLIVVAVVVIALILWIIHYETRGKYVEGTNDAYIRANSVTASPKISGYVEQVYVADNQDVKAGQPLVRIDPRDYKAATAQYRAQIDVAEANAENVRAGIREQEAAIAQARAQLAASRADAAFRGGRSRALRTPR